MTYTLNLPHNFLLNAIRQYHPSIDCQLFLLVLLCKYGLIWVHTSLCLYWIMFNAFPIEIESRYASVNQAIFDSYNG